ncbi:Adenylate cyclase associated (CAP) C terminal family protein [Leishmania donovani]|nr:Adenylate cyclase associated (CAP) C terminal family protein [Leishmania donovani]TPP49596.1 Adenylate cyclase associated (CAP) C terminal family protein [Leishmania donovani]
MSELEHKKAAAEERRRAQQQTERTTGEEAAQPPVLTLEGDKRWVVKYQAGSPAEQLQLELDKAEMRHAVRIENCHHAYITITNKVNSVSIVNCTKVQVALQVIVSSLEVLSCADVDVQVAQAAPTIDIERSTSVNVYLLDKDEARNTEIVTACSSTVNVLFPSEKDEDIVERAIPEQFVTRIVPDGKGGHKLCTKPSESF